MRTYPRRSPENTEPLDPDETSPEIPLPRYDGHPRLLAEARALAWGKELVKQVRTLTFDLEEDEPPTVPLGRLSPNSR